MQNNDLISRAAAIDALTDANLRRNVDSVCDGDMNRTRRAAQRVIAQLPVVDAAPVVHGRWIPKVIHMNTPDYYACSVCGHEVDEEFTSAIPVPYVYKFCPHCGAKMDGGDEA